MENLAIDENGRNGLGAITNDVNELIKNLRVNPMTGRLLVDAHLTSTNTSIGDTIPGGTAGSVLFLGLGSTLAQDNANFFWNDTSNFLGLGNNTPSATLDITGTFQYVDGNESNNFILISDGSGNASWADPTTIPGISGYDLIQNQGISVTQRTTINLTNLLTASDVGGKTQLDINVVNLGNNNTFINTLTTNSTFITDITNIVSTNGSLTVQDEGVSLPTLATTLNFVGAGVTATGAGAVKTITIPGGGGGGTVTSVSVVTANGFAGSVANPTTTPAITISTNQTGILTGNGTAIAGTSFAQGDLFYGSAANTITVLNKNTSATRYLSNTGASNNPAWAQINLTNGVTGALPIANGGTGQTTQTAAFDALAPTTTKGDIIVHNGTDNVRFPAGADGEFIVYDSGTATGLNYSSGATSQFVVNADEGITAWSTSPMVIDSDLGWTISAAGFTPFANGWIITANTAGDASIAVFGDSNFGGGGTPQQNSFGSGTWRIRIKAQITNANAAAGTATNRYYFFGLSTSGSSQVNGDITDVTDRVGIAVYDGDIYHVTADGTTVTATNIGTRAADQWDVVIVDFDRTTARFWLNGTPFTTTSTVPDSGNVKVALGGYNGTGSAGGISVISPVISTQYNP